MKSLIIATMVVVSAALAGCAVGVGRHGAYAEVDIRYVWDPVRVQYYHVYNGERRYMPREWRHPHGDNYGK